MYCKKCGNQIPEGSKFCAGCGAPVESAEQQTQQTNSYAQQNYQPQYQQPMYVQREQNILAILGLVFAFVFCPVGLGLSIAGYKKAKELNGDNQGIALAGIIISAISIGLYVLALISVIIVYVTFWQYIDTFYSAQFFSQILGVITSIL